MVVLFFGRWIDDLDRILCAHVSGVVVVSLVLVVPLQFRDFLQIWFLWQLSFQNDDCILRGIAKVAPECNGLLVLVMADTLNLHKVLESWILLHTSNIRVETTAVQYHTALLLRFLPVYLVVGRTLRPLSACRSFFFTIQFRDLNFACVDFLMNFLRLL